MRISNTSPFNTRNQLEPIEKDAAVNANVANANAFNANNDSPGLTTSRNNFDQRNSQRTDNSESSISLEQSQKSPSVYENINDTGASQQVNGSSPVDSIIGSRKFEGSVVKYRFMPADMSVPKPFDEEVDPDETLTTQQWSADQKALARQAMDSISDVANIRFVEAKDNEEPDWQLAAGQSKSGRSWMNFPGNGQQIASLHWPENASGTDHLMPGGRAYFTILHEFGHGLGLEHPFDGVVMEGLRQGQAYGAGEALLNNNMHTIMSYNHAQAPLNLSAEELFDRANPSTLMPLDIAALQQKYGANTSHAQEDNVYELVDENKPGTAFSTIWDTGGDDTIKYSGTGNATLDLRAATLQYEEGGGGFSSRASLFAREGSSPIQGGLTIANGVVIENATGGSGNDRLIGNDADNTFTGNAGRDFIQGQALSFDTVDYSTELGDIGIHADLTLNNTSTIRDTFGDIESTLLQVHPKTMSF